MSDANDPFEVFRRLWGPLGIPVPGMAMPTLDPEELDKRISDLRSIEGWLSMNLNMLKIAINGLELQKAALQAMRGPTGPGQAAGGEPPASVKAFADLAASGAAAGGMLWPWMLMQQAMQGKSDASQRDEPAAGGGKKDQDK